MLLECGHEPSPHEAFTTGYGVNRETGARSCYDCCLKRELEEMRGAQRWTAYLSEDGTALQNWPGGTLARVTRITERRNNFAGKLYHVWAVTAEGVWWYGDGLGKGMYIQIRRSNRQTEKWRKRHGGKS